jgi:hypothetical protein
MFRVAIRRNLYKFLKRNRSVFCESCETHKYILWAICRDSFIKQMYFKWLTFMIIFQIIRRHKIYSFEQATLHKSLKNQLMFL